MDKEEIAVVIDEDGSVYPIMDVFSNDNDEDVRVVDAVRAHLEKVGRKLGILYRYVEDDDEDPEEIAVVINADNSVFPLDLVFHKDNTAESALLDVIRSTLRMDKRRLGTAVLPVEVA